jgi:hypothetical protein
VKDARLPVQSHPDQSDRLFMRHPRLSFARKQAERDWQQISPVAPTPMIAVTPPRPAASRLATVNAKRQAPPRRDRIRGWISDSALREAADRKRAFVQPAR